MIVRPTALVVRNSGWSYLQLATGVVSDFLTATLLLKALGVEAYGSYASVVALSSFGLMLQAAVQRTSTRFLGVELGKPAGLRRMSETFSSSWTLGLLSALTIVAVGESFGVWVLESFMRFPAEFVPSVRVAFQVILLAMTLRLQSMPFVGRIIASERLSVLAMTALGVCVFRLSAAGVLFVVPDIGIPGYALLVACGVGMEFAVLALYCRQAFADVSFRLSFRAADLREQGAFLGWGLFSSFANMLKYNGTGVLVNAYGGVTASAAWDLALKTGFFLPKISEGILQAATPRVLKLWSGAGRRVFLAFSGMTMKWTFAGTLAVVVPLLVFARQILNALFPEPLPPDVVLFLVGLTVHFTLDSLTAPLTMMIHATGRIVVYQIGVSLAMSSGFVFSWLAFRWGLSPWNAAWCVAGGTLLSLVYRVWCLGWILSMPIRRLLGEMLWRHGK